MSLSALLSGMRLCAWTGVNQSYCPRLSSCWSFGLLVCLFLFVFKCSKMINKVTLSCFF